MLSGEIWAPQPRGGPASCIRSRLRTVDSVEMAALLVSNVAVAGGSVPVLVTAGHHLGSHGPRQHFS